MALILFLILICLSAFFSSSETAFFSLSKTTLNRWRFRGSFLQRKVEFFLQTHAPLLITILLGNTFINVYLTILGEHIKDDLGQSFLADLLAPFIITTVLLIFGEIIPKAFALKNAELIAPFYALPLQILFYLLRPLSYLFERLMQIWVKEEKKAKISIEELSTFVKIADEEKIFNCDEVSILKNIFELRNLFVINCLTPRKKLVTVSTKSTYSEISVLIPKYRHSRLPVIDEETDELCGVLVVKRFKTLPYSLQNKWLSLAIEKPYFIPEQALLNKVARNFSQKRVPMAIVVDEYGSISGLLTYQDIVERVIGDVPDEYKKVPDSLIEQVENHWLLKGLVEFKQLEKYCNIEFNYDGKARTVNGYLLESLSRLPEQDDVVVLGDYQFKVEQTSGPCVIEIIMSKVNT